MPSTISWASTGDEIIMRYPSMSFAWGTRLLVGEKQSVVLVYNRKVCDLFGPGEHTITTATAPLLTGCPDVPFGGTIPFLLDVIFLSKQIVTPRYAVTEETTMRDGVKLKMFGKFSYKVMAPRTFVEQVCLASDVYTSEAVNGYVTEYFTTKFASILHNWNAKQLYNDIEKTADDMTRDVEKPFAEVGLNLVDIDVDGLVGGEDTEKLLASQPELVSCLKCGSQIRSMALFCPHCGAKMDMALNYKLCSMCGKKAPAEAKFCNICGTKMQ